MKFSHRILWLRAQEYLQRYKPQLIGIAGSTGKTIVKDATALALKGTHKVRSSPYSYNTPIGVAMAILGVTKKTLRKNWFRILTKSKVRELTEEEPDVIVLELGADRPGDIDFFANKLKFNIGVITNVQSTHLRLFNNREYVAHEMESLMNELTDDGTIILNADDEMVAGMAKRAKGNVFYFGESEKAEARLMRINRRKHKGLVCEILIDSKYIELNLPHVIARYHIHHLVAAIAVAKVLRMDLNAVAKRLQAFIPPAGRMRLFEGVGGSVVIDDSYSASPESTLGALDTLLEIDCENRKIAIIGDMLDLGGESLVWHKTIGKKAAQVADILVAVGSNMRQAGGIAVDEGGVDVHHFDDSREVGKWMRDMVKAGDLILVKGSRDMRMENVTRDLLVNESDRKELV